MNERIETLAKAAGYDMINKAAMRALGFDVEKFAELIVMESLEQIDKIRDGCEEDGEDQQALGAAWAGLAVARHFGVE